ncbi:hypothetical protein GCM10009690_22490 [Brevibacterium permense]|uniref:Uncharacterized protein n=1 Tax=Brevibacterium permense TaxID=234834 RepID=A0ABN2AGQ1_9MICO
MLAEHIPVGRAEDGLSFSAFVESISCGEEAGSLQAWQATVLTAPGDARVPNVLLNLFPRLFRVDPRIDGGRTETSHHDGTLKGQSPPEISPTVVRNRAFSSGSWMSTASPV